MKMLLGSDLTGSYTFDPVAKTVTFSNLAKPINLSNILLITNVTRNVIIYNFADPATGEMSFNNNVLTLVFDTTSHSSSDVLQIFLDVESYEDSLATLLRRMNKLLESNAVVDLQQRQRLTIDAIRSSATATTDLAGTMPVSGLVSVGNQVTSTSQQNSPINPYTLSTSQATGLIMEGPVHQVWRIIYDAQSCYSSTIRSRLTFT